MPTTTVPSICAALFAAASALATAGTARLDSGGPGGRYGPIYEADRLYTTANGSGAIGGAAITPQLVSNGQAIENTPHTLLYNSQREGMSEYRFDVPNGSYLVTLQFVELLMNGPNLRRFSVLAEGAPLLTDFDIYARWGRNYAVTYQFAVTVADGQLNLTFPASIGQPAVAAVAVQSIARDALAPRKPAQVTATGGYLRNIVAWPDQSEPDLAGYLVARASAAAGPYTVLTPAPTPASRYFDDAVTPFAASHYRVAAVDVFGNQSAWSAPVAAAPRDKTQSTLPVYELTIAPEQYAVLQADSSSDYVSGTFSAGGVVYPDIGVRFRGATTLNNQKKSWKVNFKKNSPFEGRDKLNQKALGMDPGMLSECLSAALFTGTSALVADCSHSHLAVNGEFAGVFSRLEEVDDDFFVRRGISPKGQLLEAEGPNQANFRVLDDYTVAWNDQSSNDDGYPALAQLVQTVNDTPDASFAPVIAALVNVDAYLDYLATIALTGDWDHIGHNFYVYRSPDSPVWEVFGKDFDQGFLRDTLPLLYATKTSPRQSINTYNVLTSRVLAVPRFRQSYVNKIAELLASRYTTAQLAQRIDAMHAAISDDARLDVYKRWREDNTGFEQSPAAMKDSIARRIAYIEANLGATSPNLAQPALLNEVLPDNRSGIATGAGNRSPWLELHNPSTQPYTLTGHWLSGDPAQPTGPLGWQFPSGTTIPAGGYLLVWLDNLPAAGELHASFTVSARGQAVALYAPAGGGSLTLLDTVAWRALPADASYGRRAGGSALWAPQPAPTPRAGNAAPR